MITLKELKNIWEANNITIIIYNNDGDLFNGDLMELNDNEILELSVVGIYNNYFDNDTIEIEVF